MEHFDDNKFDLFDDRSVSDLPDGYEWNDMKDDIYAKMGKKKKRVPFFWILIGILTATSLLFFIRSVTYKNQDKVAINNAGTENENEILDKPILNLNVQSDQKKITFDKNITKTNIPKAGFKNQILSSEDAIKNIEGNTYSSNNEISATNPLQKAFSPIVLKEDQSINNDHFVSPSSETENTDSFSRELTFVKPLKNLNNNLSLFRNIENELSYIYDNENSHLTELKEKSPFRLSILGSVNMWKAPYSGSSEIGKDRNDSTRHLAGWNIDVRLDKYVMKDFFIGLEAGYHVWNSKFQSDVNRQVPVEFKEVLTRIRHNVITGSTIEMNGDTTVMGIEHRKVIHYNRLSAFRLGTVFGYSWKPGKLSLDGILGTGMLFSTSQKGKTYIADKEVIDYDSDNPIYKPGGLSFKFGINMTYQFSNSTGIGFHINHERFLANWSNDNLIIKPARSDLGLNLSYNF